MAVTAYYGPSEWFGERVKPTRKESLREAVNAHDDERNQTVHIHHVPGQEPPRVKPKKRKRPQRLVADSGDYASLNEHVITNFSWLARALNPKELHLHNPPEQVKAQLEKTFPNSFRVERYSYPMVTLETLRAFRDHFGEHLVGQAQVRDAMLRAMYPLTRARRNRPVVVMFYGPSGVGKTETAKFINDLLQGSLMRTQFSMFQNDSFASYLFGGKHSERSFAHELIDRDSGVILIDEFDKAASVFHSAFYELFDEGVFSDKNYRADVGRALIICTSNYDSEAEIRRALGEALSSRFDAMIQFTHLSRDEAITVVERQITRRLGELEPDELALVAGVDFESMLRSLAEHAGNIREVGKRVDAVIADELVHRSLADTQRG
ncbi:AAA family ATPase [Microbacterium sp. NPDC078849]|uniref:AAA family ATPase n=1 Tax=unclassified Microbacterium TaxID=2609290 RepID=UPI00344EC0B1